MAALEAHRPLVISGRGGAERQRSRLLDASGALYLDTQESRGLVAPDHPVVRRRRARAGPGRGGPRRHRRPQARLSARLRLRRSSRNPRSIPIADTAGELIDRRDDAETFARPAADFFERLIVDLLVAMGYGGTHTAAATQLGRSGDGGVDGVIDEDRLGLDRVYVQAKRYAATSSIGRPDVQGFVGSLVGLGAGKGVFVTTSSFSRQAVEFVDRLPQRVILIDGQSLADLMIEYNVGVRINRALEFKRLDEGFFSEDE